jgi:hypothetical protein
MTHIEVPRPRPAGRCHTATPRRRWAARAARRFLPVALVALALSAGTAQAQLGAALGYRSMNSEEEFLANSDRRGLEARAIYDIPFSPAFALRLEGAFAQMQFQRDDGSQTFQVSENGFEIAPALRAEAVRGAFTGLYATLGPVASFRAVCGSSSQFSSNGRVACDEGETYRTGYSAGLGFRAPFSRHRDLTVEVRYMGGTVAAAGSEMLALSLGLRVRK